MFDAWCLSQPAEAAFGRMENMEREDAEGEMKTEAMGYAGM